MSGPYTIEVLDTYQTEGPAIYTQTFFIEGEYMGEIKRPKFYIRGKFYPPDGTAYWCGICNRVWAILPVAGEYTDIYHCTCERHKVGEQVDWWNAGWGSYPGSVFMNFGNSSWISPEDIPWPREVLKREFLLYCKRKEIGT